MSFDGSAMRKSLPSWMNCRVGPCLQAKTACDFPWLARLYLDGRLKLDELITQRLPLERIDEGFDAMRLGRTLRTVLEIAH